MMEAEQMEGETTEATVATATSDESGSEKVLDLPCWDITNYTPGIAGTHSMQAKACCISIVELGERRTASDAVCPLVTSAQFLWLFQSDSWPKLRLQRRARKRWRL